MPQAFAIPTEHQRTAPAALPVDRDFNVAMKVLAACGARDGLREVRAVVQAIRAEREACARIADSRARIHVAACISQDIRARTT